MFDLFDDVSEKMVNRCVVVNCSSNKRKPGGRRVSLFKVPKDPKLLTQWKLNLPAIRKVLDSNCYVCEKHFNKSDVLKTYEENLPSGKWEIARSRATLKSGAIPMAVKGKRTSKKKNTSVLNNSADQATSNNVDGKGNIHEEHNYPMQYADNSAVQSIFNGMSNVIVEYDNVIMDTEENKAEANCNFEKPFTFKTLWKNLATLKLPNAAWDYFMSPQRNLISFFAIQADCVLRRVNIYSDLSMQVTIDLVLVPEKRLCNLTSLNDVVWFLLRVSQWNLCETLKNSKRCVPLGPCEGIAPRDIHLGAPRRRCLSCAIMAKKNSKVKQQVKPQTLLVQESTCDQS